MVLFSGVSGRREPFSPSAPTGYPMKAHPPRLRLIAPPPSGEGEPREVPHDLDGVFRAYARYVGAIALRILGRPDEVDDLVQDVFLDAHGSLHTLRDPEALKAWLATLTVRKAMRRLKRRRLRRFLGLDDLSDYGQLLVDPAASPEDRAQVGEVYRLLDGVPAEERAAWVLRHIEGHKLARVAELCGCSLATAKRRVASAHAMLYGELVDD